MKIKSAVKKLENNGFVVNNDSSRYTATRNNDIVSFIAQNDCAICIRVRSKNDVDDVQTDYSAGVYVSNISQAIRLAN